VNLAIVVAVSDYIGDVGPLPACSADGSVLHDMLVSSGQFSEVLLLSTNTSSIDVKDKLVDFAKGHAGEDIDQIFFYFTV
jgi:hypothetical protein